jgi:hypothetical protein
MTKKLPLGKKRNKALWRLWDSLSAVERESIEYKYQEDISSKGQLRIKKVPGLVANRRGKHV